MTTVAKRKVSVTLDADLVAAVEAGSESLSARLNRALQRDIDEEQRSRALAALLDRLARERGALDRPEDEAEIARLTRLLGGV